MAKQSGTGAEKRICRFDDCGKEFEPKKDWHVYCDDPCRKKDYMKRNFIRRPKSAAEQEESSG